MEHISNIIGNVIQYWQIYTAIGILLLIIFWLKPLKLKINEFFAGVRELFTWSGFFLFLLLVLVFTLLGFNLGLGG